MNGIACCYSEFERKTDGEKGERANGQRILSLPRRLFCFCPFSSCIFFPSLFLPLVFPLLLSRPLEDGACLEVEQVTVLEHQGVHVGDHMSRKRVSTSQNEFEIYFNESNTLYFIIVITAVVILLPVD